MRLQVSKGNGGCPQSASSHNGQRSRVGAWFTAEGRGAQRGPLVIVAAARVRHLRRSMMGLVGRAGVLQ